MSRDTLKLITEEGKSIYSKLSREFYLNRAGLKNKTELTDIFKSCGDLLEPEIFQSIKDANPESEEEGNVLKLSSSFLAQAIILGKSPQIEDGILEIEASSTFNVAKSKVPFRKYKSALLKKSKKEETEDIIEKRNRVLEKLNQLYLRQYAYKQKDSHDLGYSSYLNLYETLENHDPLVLIEQAKQFIRDTEYVSRDLLHWFLTKKMDIQIKDATVYDMFYLLTSYELKDSFPKLTPHSMAQSLLDETGIMLPSVIKFDTDNRNGHIEGSFLYTSEPGVEMLISSNIEGNIFDYESFLESFGHALCYGFTNRDDYFEYTNLREKSYVNIFSTLFRNLLFEPSWLKKQFRMDAENDFLKFINLRSLMRTRILCAKVIYEIGFYQNQENKAEMFNEIMKIATHCKPDTKSYFYDIQPHLGSLDSFKGYLIEAKLRRYMLENHDEQWWRQDSASEFLTGIWETGGRTSVATLSKKCGIGDLNISELLQTFEKALG